jgi:hypothetical protein
MEVVLKLIKQENFDRYIFVEYYNSEIIGLNFHQGLDKIIWDYKTPCPALSDIYERLNDKNHINLEEDRINKAISLYEQAFIFQY